MLYLSLGQISDYCKGKRREWRPRKY